ncbi:proline-rich proteoglycan 2-like [Ammospiza nelsoni]|uniref:proline-rich proteoglycan 2-like n=1 Tax=Ammospiza nelsoni TaxID=2857394 RepID=UPI002869BA8D|nr:proline-rich proteoglycan 2-like [Ammospiza nelsoni]
MSPAGGQRGRYVATRPARPRRPDLPPSLPLSGRGPAATPTPARPRGRVRAAPGQWRRGGTGQSASALRAPPRRAGPQGPDVPGSATAPPPRAGPHRAALPCCRPFAMPPPRCFCRLEARCPLPPSRCEAAAAVPYPQPLLGASPGPQIPAYPELPRLIGCRARPAGPPGDVVRNGGVAGTDLARRGRGGAVPERAIGRAPRGLRGDAGWAGQATVTTRPRLPPRTRHCLANTPSDPLRPHPELRTPLLLYTSGQTTPPPTYTPPQSPQHPVWEEEAAGRRWASLGRARREAPVPTEGSEGAAGQWGTEHTQSRAEPGTDRAVLMENV